ncbi:MAG TPA: hypothetical protein VNA25_30485 [Phycisphaerae bacterium]|nr:hypothetical protein [Phycisphaerae bacterium]
MADATEFTLAGPAQILWGDAGVEEEFGKTEAGPTIVRIREETFPVTFHQTGVNPWDIYGVGKTVEVEANFANMGWDLLLNVMPTEAKIYGGGVTTPTPAPGDQALDIQVGLGTSHRSYSKRLILKPYWENAPDTNPETWFIFPLAFPRIDAEIEHGPDVQKVIHVLFEIFPVSQACPRLFFMGNEANLPC